MLNKICDKYELQFQKKMEDIASDCYYLIHKKTKMKVLILSNDDNNKVFSIGFKTMSNNSTGVAHILEHSVLCGSKKYPIKDPFIELIKGSLNTFLNAMTYPDKTLYPIASTNFKDFKNLMDVYLDAVFNPNIYKHKEIFMQEGWHYILNDKKDDIKISGVVYNEMKGVYSSVSDLLVRQMEKSLFNGHFYSEDSGGDPKYIPNLTYEDFLEFHKKHYNPSNAYLYLYGDMDINDTLEYIDSEYVSKYEEMKNLEDIEMPSEKNCKQVCKVAYPISSTSELKDTTYFSYNVAVDVHQDRNLYQALDILSYVLVNAPGSPISKALYDKKIGQDISASFENSFKKPVFSIEVANTTEDRFDEFQSIIKEVLEEQVKNGIDRDALLGAINSAEFKFREADYGIYPKGLMYYLIALNSWLYYDDEPTLYLEQLSMFDFLKKNIDKGYFENIIEKYILGNAHKSVVCLYPELDLQKKEDEDLYLKNKKYKESLSDNQIDALINENINLNEYQSVPDTKDDLKCLPLLDIADIEKKAKIYKMIEDKENNKILWHECDTNGIAYVKIMFDANDLSIEYLPYLSILSSILRMVDTKKYSYNELSNKINIDLGGLNLIVDNFDNSKDKDTSNIFLSLGMKFLYDKVDVGLKLAKEILLDSIIDNKKRIKEILQELKTDFEDSAIQSGNALATLLATAIVSDNSKKADMIKGLAFYDRLNFILQNYDREYPIIIEYMKNLIEYLFNKDRLTLAITSNENFYNIIKGKFENFAKDFQNFGTLKPLDKADIEKIYVNTGIIAPTSTVQYVARAGVADNFKYNGSFQVLKVILSFDYLWNEIRVKGGAYGCGANINRNGVGYFVSYRDPHLKMTEEKYEKTPNYIEKLELSKREIQKYIIGAISNLDVPLSNSLKGVKALNSYMCDISDIEYQKERDEVLATSIDSIKDTAKIIRDILSNRNACTLGSADMLNKEKSMFSKIRLLSSNE